MKFELKSIKHSPSLSEETEAFTADLYIDGKKVAYCKNTGQGGCTDIHAYDKSGNEIIAKAEAYCKTLPKVEAFGSKFDVDLEGKVDELLSEHILSKKLSKDMKKGIVLEANGGYDIVTWKGHTIESILKHPQGEATLKATILKCKSEGKKILNTNLPKGML